MKLRPAGSLITAVAAVLAVSLLVAGCGGGRQALVPAEAASARIAVDTSVPSDPSLEELIEPYRQVFHSRMGEELAHCPASFRTGRPEGNMGALIADILLESARSASGQAVDAAITNNGGLRISWAPGVITLGLVYELMPFDNELVLLRLDAAQMQSLAGEIADRGGEPISGMELVLAGNRLMDVRVGSAPIEDRDYWVATTDYLADGGGGMPTLWEPLEMRKVGVLLRDAIVDAVRAYGAAGGDPDRLGDIPMPSMGRIREGDTGSLWEKADHALPGYILSNHIHAKGEAS